MTGVQTCALPIYQPVFDIQALAAMHEWQFLMPETVGELSMDAPENVTFITFSEENMPVDIMPFIDVVLCKPGYGILSECWRTARPIAWVERPDFPEFPMLKDWLEHVFPAHGMSRAIFASGDWLSALAGAMACERSFPELKEDGVQMAAEIILSGQKV